MLKTDYLLIAIAATLLLFINWLAFHDFGEPHTVRDWLMLAASVLVFCKRPDKTVLKESCSLSCE